MTLTIHNAPTNNHAERIIAVAEDHELPILRRLHEKALRDGPDGEVLRHRGDVAELGAIILVLQEAQGNER